MKKLEIDPLRAIPKDDEEPVDTTKAKVTTDEDQGEQAGDEGASEGNGEDATVIAEGTDGDDAAGDGVDEGEEYSAEDIEAVLNEGRDRIPKARFDEVNEGFKRVSQHAQTLEERLAKIEADRRKAEEPKARDFSAELKATKLAFEQGDISADEYEAQRDLIIEARLEAKLEGKIKPLEDTVRQREARAAQAELQAQLDTVAAKAFAKYPFLDHESDERDDEAIAAVKAQRAELEADGLHPAKALLLAVQIVAPAYATDAPPSGDADVDPAEIARKRKMQARKALIEAVDGQPPNIGRTGVGTKVTDNKVQIGRGVEDHERWLKIPENERAKRIVAVG